MQELLREVERLRAQVERLKTQEAGAIISSGASFPAAPLDGQLVYRTDRDLLYFYNAATAQWLTVAEYVINLNKNYDTNAATYTGTGSERLQFAVPSDADMRITRLTVTAFVFTTNNNTDYWTVSFDNFITPIMAISTQNLAANQWHRLESTVAVNVTVSTATYYRETATRVALPGNLALAGLTATYRKIG